MHWLAKALYLQEKRPERKDERSEEEITYLGLRLFIF
jgi:hypothetical protein